MRREPIVAGRFYPAGPAALAAEARGYLSGAKQKSEAPTILAMSPHAGYLYSGAVCGATLGQANLADTILLLGPNHTGRGRPLAVWSRGVWAGPGFELAVDEDTASALLAEEPALEHDTAAHLGEHSLEVILPFLWILNPDARIVPVAVAVHDPLVLDRVGRAMAATLAARGRAVSVVVSSDMSHYLPAREAKKRDALALERILALDPIGLSRVVRERDISMCGAAPMALGLTIALGLGASRAVLAAYATSGEVSGDMEQVVGYAGVLVE